MKAKKILDSLLKDETLKDAVLEEVYPFPNPFCFNKSKISAFVLGADPSNFSDNGEPVILRTVFAIGSGDNRYFRDILKNLEVIGLNLKNIYVQNLVRNYMKQETGSNKLWPKFAKYWVDTIKEEFDFLDYSLKTPVFVTAYPIYDFLLNDEEERINAESIYNCSTSVLIAKDKNKLERPLIPLFRHYKYKLTDQKWPKYLREIKCLLNLK